MVIVYDINNVKSYATIKQQLSNKASNRNISGDKACKKACPGTEH